MANTYPIQVTSTYGEAIIVYTTMSNPPADPPSTNPDDYNPVYTKLGTVAANGSGDFITPDPLARVVIARESDQFPVELAVVSALDPSTQTVTVSAGDATIANSGWTFYQQFASQPYSPMALNFTQLVETTDPASLAPQTAAFFNQNGFPGMSFGLFSAIGYWATNQLYAFPGTYWCYGPPAGASMGFILPTTPVGIITIGSGTASYAPTGGNTVPLSFTQTQLSSTGATPVSGIQLTAIIRDLAWEGKPDEITWAFVGTNNGSQLIAQSYQNPGLAWYAVLYDLTYGVFFTIQFAMALDAAANLLSQIPNGLQWLAQNAGKLADKVRDFANRIGDSACPDSAFGDPADPINVDVDVDVDVDIDIDIDVEVDVDIDVDVDVDIDVDVDVDFGVVVDVDVDVDIDVDIDVVTDTETDVDIDVDVDVDIDTDVDVQPGMIGQVLSGIGKWIMTKALPTLLEGVAISVAFQTAGALLNAWKDADQESMNNLQPRQTTGLGLLINYMFDRDKSIADRWSTFSQYVEESQADTGTLQVNISTILQTRNAFADIEAGTWKWSPADETAAVNAMQADTGANTYEAFQTLASYTFQNKPLPVKVGAAVAMQYLKAS